MAPVFEGASPRIDRRRRACASGRARTYTTPSGMRNRSFADIASSRACLRSSAPRDVQTQQRTRFAPHTSACRVDTDEIKAGTRGRERIRALRDRSARPRSVASAPRRRRRVRLGARALWRGAATLRPTLPPRKSFPQQTKACETRCATSASRLPVCFAEFSNRQSQLSRRIRARH